MIDGMMAVWKEPDFTSHDVVAKLRGILHQKKIGHTGTLDPKAEGVLVVGLGTGTRACDLLPDATKVYEAQMILGIATDTEDIWGTPYIQEDVSVEEEEFRKAILSFQGTYLQTPPMYSAKKVGGRKLYDLARQGKVVEREAVPVTIDNLEIRSITSNCAEFTVTCSAGTYIRTLCADIGKKLGTAACMSRLTRSSAGGFTKDQALTLSQIEQARDQGKLAEYVIPVDQALSCYPSLCVSAGFTKSLINGNAFPPEALAEPASKSGELYRVYLEKVGFIGIFRWSDRNRMFVPYKIFYRAGG